MSKTADLTPPLGFPGGMKHLLERIDSEVRNPRMRQHLLDEAACGDKITNQEAHSVYKMDTEKGPGRIIKRFRISPHAQYRMDLRGVTVTEIRLSLSHWEKQIEKWHSTHDPRFRRTQEMMQMGEVLEWIDTKLKLFLAFASSGQGQVDIVTTYWKGQRDPKPQGHCRRRAAGGFRSDNKLPGQSTFTKSPQDGDTGDASKYRQVGLPRPQKRWEETRLGPPVMNTPGPSGTGADGESIHKDKVRTRGVPGDQATHPVGDITDSKVTPKRRQLASGYYDAKRVTLEEVRRKWASEGMKIYDRSMPLMVPVQDLWKVREYTWTRDKARPGSVKVQGKWVPVDGPTKWDVIEESMREEGFKTEFPLQVMMGKDGGVRVGEGNHRLAIARDLGIREVPVWFQFYERTAPKNPTLAEPKKIEPKPEVIKRVVERKIKRQSEKDEQIEELMRLLRFGGTKGKPFPGMDRQREQKGRAKLKTEIKYKQERSDKKLDQKRYHKRVRNLGQFKRDQQRRDESPKRFERFPGGGVSDPAEYQREYREENKKEIAKSEAERRLKDKKAYTIKQRPKKRRRRQHGVSKNRSRKKYRKNRGRNRQQARLRYKKLRHNPSFKKQQKIRRKHPERFRMRRAEVLTAPEIAFVIGTDLDLGYVRSMSGMSSLVTYFERDDNNNVHKLRTLPLATFMASVVFMSEADMDAMFELIDQEVGPEAYGLVINEDTLRGSAGVFGVDCDTEEFKEQCTELVGKRDLNEMNEADLAKIDTTLVNGMTYGSGFREETGTRPHEDKLIDPQDDDYIYGIVNLDEDVTHLASQWMKKRVSFMYEKRPPDNVPAENKFDRGSKPNDEGKDWPEPDKKEIPTREPQTHGFPGPGSRVLPTNHNQGPTKVKRFAFKIGDIYNLCSPEQRAKTEGIQWRIFRADTKNAVVLFDVTGSDGGKYRVRMKALRRGNVKDLQKLDLMVSCTCPAWRWQGPEHWAKKNNYLYGRPKGTASKPVIRDPKMEKGACKHVLTVLDHAVKYGWRVRPYKKRTASLRYLADTGTPVEVWAVHTVDVTDSAGTTEEN